MAKNEVLWLEYLLLQQNPLIAFFLTFNHTEYWVVPKWEYWLQMGEQI